MIVRSTVRMYFGEHRKSRKLDCSLSRACQWIPANVWLCPHKLMLIRLPRPHKTSPLTTRLTKIRVKVIPIQAHRTAPRGFPNSCNLGRKKRTRKLSSHWQTLWKAVKTHCKLHEGHCGERREAKRSTEPEHLLPKSKRWTIRAWSGTHQKRPETTKVKASWKCWPNM